MKRGNISRRGQKSWQLKFEAPSIDGKRQCRYATVRGTYQDAQKELTRLLGEKDAGTLTDPSNATVAEYVRQWLDSAHAQSPKTIERYGQLAEKQIITHIGAEKLQKLTSRQVKDWHKTLLDDGLSPRTIGHAHRLLQLVLACAIKDGLLARNVATVHRPPQVEETELEILEPDQVANITAKLDGHSLFPIVALAINTGMRRGELLGLQWGDVDLDGGTLRVERSVEETKAGLRLKSPKTKRGRRNITLPAETVSMLRAHKIEQMRLRLVLGAGNITSETLVFSDVNGGLIRPRNLTKSWSRVCAYKKLPSVSFHSLRHTHASILIRAGVDILTISRRLGHSKPSVTLDVYGHLIEGADKAAAEAISRVLK